MAQKYEEFTSYVNSMLGRYFAYSSTELEQIGKHCQELGLEELAKQANFKASLRREQEEQKRIREERRKLRLTEKQQELEARQSAFNYLLSIGLVEGSLVVFPHKTRGKILCKVTGISRRRVVIDIRAEEKPQHHFVADPRNITMV